jgi:hypothetical protein
MSETKVYVVSDCGISWPAAGVIFGIYDNEQAANQRLQELQNGPVSEYAHTQIKDVGVREFIINKATQG